MKLILWILISLSFVPNTLVWAAAEDDKKAGTKYLILYKGIEHEETLSSLPTAAEFNGDWKGITKLGVAREYQKIRFTPTTPGIGTLSIHDKKGNKIFEYRVEVRETNLTRIVREIRQLLSEIEGITIKIVNNRVVVDGKVIHPEDLNRIVGVLKQYGDQAASLVEVSPFAQQKIAEIIEREVNNPDVQVRARNGKYILTGEVGSAFEKDQVELIARTYVPPPVSGEAENQDIIKKRKEELVINLVNIRAPAEKPPKKMIQLVLHYVELNKDYSNSSRFQWTPTLGDDSSLSFTRDSRSPSGLVSTITGTVSNLLPKLNWAKAHGLARVLTSTNVITEEDQTGVVNQSTELQQPTIAQNNAVVPGAKITVQLNSSIKPTIENPRTDLIRLDMTFNIGSPISITGAGVLTSTDTLKTIVSVRSGESAAVGGLIKSNQTMDYNKLPDGISNPLFSFYSSKAFQKNQSQFVVFVTPVIKSSASSGTEKIKEKFRLNE